MIHARALILSGAVLILSRSISAQVTARQGEQDPYAFKGSMIVELPFEPADPVHQQRMANWYSPLDSIELRKYQCDRIRVWSLMYRVKKSPKNQTLPVLVRFVFTNPDQNHDKLVELVLEIHDGDAVLGVARTSAKVEEDGVATKDVALTFGGPLKTDPLPQMRITIRTRDI